MNSSLLDRPDTVAPTGDDTELALEASRTLAAHRAPGNLRVRLDDGSVLLLPRAVRDLLAHVLTEIARGNAVTMIPIHAQLTTQEAADILNVSRPFVIKLIESGQLKFHKVGTHRRINMADLDAYRAKVARERDEALEELAAEAQTLGLGY